MAVPQGIGQMGNVEGRIVGLNAMANLVSDAGPVAAEKMLKMRAKKKAAKDHNDRPVSATVGSDGTRPVRDISWMQRI